MRGGREGGGRRKGKGIGRGREGGRDGGRGEGGREARYLLFLFLITCLVSSSEIFHSPILPFPLFPIPILHSLVPQGDSLEKRLERGDFYAEYEELPTKNHVSLVYHNVTSFNSNSVETKSLFTAKIHSPLYTVHY